MSTLKETPLWFQRLVLVVFSPLMLCIILLEALGEAWIEFRFDIASSWEGIKNIWRGE